MKLSIVIVNYNVKYFLEQCLHSIQNAITDIETEIFVVDNHSIDGSESYIPERFPNIKYIYNTQNTGFSAANNQAIREASGEFILLLNPDTLIEEDTLTRCIDFFNKTPDAGSIGVKMINGKGEFLPESKRGLPIPSVAFYKIFGLSKLFPKSKKFGSYHLTYLDKNKTHSVEVLSGAFMMIRKKVLDEIGLLDETFFMYGEDIDLSYRILKGGYNNYYFADTEIIHYKGESTKKNSINYVMVFYKAMKIFAQKHFSPNNAFFFNFIINAAIVFRASLAIIKRIIVKIALPLLDFGVIYTGMLLLSEYWEYAVLIHRNSSFPNEFRYLFIPIFVLLWIGAIACCKGYKAPYSLHKTNRGLIVGTTIILLIYALLPESLRFSRAMIIFGAMWAALAMNTIRYIMHKLNLKSYNYLDNRQKNILIVGKTECKRAAQLIMMREKKIGTLFEIVASDAPDFYLKIQDVIEKEKINMLILCSKDMSIKQIITIITALQKLHAEWTILPKNSNVIISAQDLYVPPTVTVIE